MRRPVIGVTEPSGFTQDCIDTIEKFYEGNPIKLCHNNHKNLVHWLDQCDGVILAGGVDIHPMVYGASVLNNYNLSRFDLQRDKRELQIIHHCFTKNIPVLGICRGHQMLGIYHGLSMIMDLSDSAICHNPQKQNINFTRDEPMHAITMSEDVQIEIPEWKEMFEHMNFTQKRRLFVNSFHHQGIVFGKETGKVVRVLATAMYSEKDKLIEMMESLPDQPRWVSCQFHPEYDWEKNPTSRMILEMFKQLLPKDEPKAEVA